MDGIMILCDGIQLWRFEHTPTTRHLYEMGKACGDPLLDVNEDLPLLTTEQIEALTWSRDVLAYIDSMAAKRVAQALEDPSLGK